MLPVDSVVDEGCDGAGRVSGVGTCFLIAAAEEFPLEGAGCRVLAVLRVVVAEVPGVVDVAGRVGRGA